MGVFGGIGDAKYSEGGVYILPGVYRLEVKATKYIKTRTGKDAFVVEFKILESNNPERPVGSLCSWMVTLDKEPALGNIKQFLMNAIPAAEDQISEEIVLFVVSDAQPLNKNSDGTPKTTIIRCSAANTKTKRNTDFTKCKFFLDGDKAGAEKDQASQQQAA